MMGRKAAASPLRFPAFDFVARPPPPPWPAWLLLACGLGLAMVGGLDWQSAREQLAFEQQRLDRAQAARSAAPRAPSAAASAARSADALAAAGAASAARRSAWAVDAALRHPWPRLFQAVERATPPGLTWIALEHDAAQPDMRLRGSARDAATALALTDALAADPLMSLVVLTRLERVDEGAKGVRFEISMRLAAADARLAGTAPAMESAQAPGGAPAAAPGVTPSATPGTAPGVAPGVATGQAPAAPVRGS